MNWEQILKDVFPLLEGTELGWCMLVCKQWRDAAQDDYLWKCICSKRWPSIYKRQSPTALNYYKLYQTLHKRIHHIKIPPPKLTFNDLEFYIDILVDDKTVFSDVVPGSSFRKIPPPEIHDLLRPYLSDYLCKLILVVEPRFTIPFSDKVRLSVFVGRKDTKKVACIINQSSFRRENRNTHWALNFEQHLGFRSPFYLFSVSHIRAMISLLFMDHTDEAAIGAFGIELHFNSAGRSENQVLWLLDVLDWK